MKKQKDQNSDTGKQEKSANAVREQLDQREENLRDNKVVNDDDTNLGRGKYQSKYGNGKSAEPSTMGGEV